MNYDVYESIFWKVAEKHSNTTIDSPLDKKTEAKVEKLIKKLHELAQMRFDTLQELRATYGSAWAFELMGGPRVDAPLGYWSEPGVEQYENFTPEELSELNSQGILSSAQHCVVAKSDRLYCLPLDADRLMSRRELQRVTGWSNDRFTRYVNLGYGGVPVLKTGKNGSANKYSAFAVYRWMLQHRFKNRWTDETPVIDSWGDSNRFGDLDDPPPTTSVHVAYSELKPGFAD